ncbi:MAG: hypothetical protein U0835_02005 [Isosphaeraceae bacterium]
MDFVSGRLFREELANKAEVLEKQLGEIRRMIEELDAFLENRAPASEPHWPTLHEKFTHKEYPTPYTPDATPNAFSTTETRADRIKICLERGGGRLKTKEIVDRLIAEGDFPPGLTKSAFYNVVDSALRAGEKKGRFRRTEFKAQWELVRDDPPVLTEGLPLHERAQGFEDASD